MKLAKLLLDNCRPKKQERKPRSYFYISEAGRTPYEIFKRLAQKPLQINSFKAWMSKGNRTHWEVYKILGRLGLLKAVEVKVGDDLFKGSIDAIPQLPGEKPMVLEIKTVSPKKFHRILKENRPTWRSYIQLQMYLNYLRKMPCGRILFIEARPNNAQIPLRDYKPRMTEFVVRKNPRVIRDTFRKFRMLKDKFVKSGVMSP